MNADPSVSSVLTTDNCQLTTAFSSTLAAAAPSASHLAVAVSGGADSMALLLLAQDWAKSHGGKITALTVDHRLRPESTAEAETVSARCKTLGIEHHILPWQSPRGTTRIQEAARDARYQLMGDWCRAHNVTHLLTAHHRDDQAETLLFRLTRGSGIEGLAAMPLAATSGDIRLVRPLLALPKSALVEFLREHGERWIEDPSNTNPRYSRVQIRTALDTEPNADAIREQAADLATRFGAIRTHLEEQRIALAARHCKMHPEGYATFDAALLDSGHAEAMLSDLTRAVGGDAYPPRTQKLARLLADLKKTPRNRTFGGCLFRWQPRFSRFLICREPMAVEGSVTLAAGERRLWDSRFLVQSADGATVRALGAQGRKQLESLGETGRLRGLPPPVASALPSFWHLEELLAVPHIHYQRGPACQAEFRPAKPLAGAAFFGLNRL